MSKRSADAKNLLSESQTAIYKSGQPCSHLHGLGWVHSMQAHIEQSVCGSKETWKGWVYVGSTVDGLGVNKAQAIWWDTCVCHVACMRSHVIHSLTFTVLPRWASQCQNHGDFGEKTHMSNQSKQQVHMFGRDINHHNKFTCEHRSQVTIQNSDDMIQGWTYDASTLWYWTMPTYIITTHFKQLCT